RSSIILLPTASPGLARDVAALLLRLGVVARVRAAKHGRVRTTVTVDVSGPAAQLRFLETVGGFGPLAGPVARLATSVAAGRRIGAQQEAFEPVSAVEVPALQPEPELAALRVATAPAPRPESAPRPADQA